MAVVGAVCLLAGWLMASLILPPVASLQSNPQRPERRPPAEPEPRSVPYAERLRLKMRDAPAVPTPRRNPFAFQASVPPTPASPAADDVVGPAPIVVQGPPFSLAGIATTTGTEGPARTAVLSMDGDVVLARVGEVVYGGYRVVRIDEDAITLVDASSQELVLRLK